METPRESILDRIVTIEPQLITRIPDAAIARYKRVADMNLEDDCMMHHQYGLRYNLSPYATERTISPFARIENQDTE